MAEFADVLRRLTGTAQNMFLKQMMEVVNRIELMTSDVIQADVNTPIRAMTEDDLARARWQYASQTRVQETPARILEFLPCAYGPGSMALAQLIKAFSPTHLLGRGDTLDGLGVLPDGQDPWANASAENKDWVASTITQTPPGPQDLHGQPMASFHGLAWFFTSQLGCFYLRPWMDPESGQVGCVAEFDQLTRFELKPDMCEPHKLQVYFVAKLRKSRTMPSTMPQCNTHRVNHGGYWQRQAATVTGPPSADRTLHSHKLVVKRVTYGCHSIESEAHPLFTKACRTIFMVAAADATIRYHALFSHALIGDIFTCATVRALPIGHPLRPLVEHLTHQVFNLNNILRMLVLAENGTLHTLFPYSWKGLQDYVKHVYDHYSIWEDGWEPFAPDSAWCRQPAFIQSVLPCIGIQEDMTHIWDALWTYTNDYLHTVHIRCDADVLRDAPLCAWVQEIANQQPNDCSAGALRRFFAAHPLSCVKRLVQMFFFHSVCTHDVSGTTDRLFSRTFSLSTQLFATDAPQNRSFAEMQRETREELPGMQLARRAHIASHATTMVVPLLAQRWGDVMLAQCPEHMKRAKSVLNSLPHRLEALETYLRDRNSRRYFPTDGLLPTQLACAICY